MASIKLLQIWIKNLNLIILFIYAYIFNVKWVKWNFGTKIDFLEILNI